MNLLLCDGDECEYYSFTQQGLDICRSLMHDTIAKHQSSSTEPSLRRPNTSMDRTTRRGEEMLSVNRLTTSIANRFLSRHSSDISYYKNTRGSNSAPNKTFDRHNKQTRTSEFICSDPLQDVKD